MFQRSVKFHEANRIFSGNYETGINKYKIKILIWIMNKISKKSTNMNNKYIKYVHSNLDISDIIGNTSNLKKIILGSSHLNVLSDLHKYA
jgi:hypothetical protein